MKNTATLKIEVAGRKPGSAATVVHAGDNTLLLEDALGQFQCPVTGVDFGVEKAGPAPGEEEEPARFAAAGRGVIEEVGPEGEAAARIAADSEDAPDSTVDGTPEEE